MSQCEYEWEDGWSAEHLCRRLVGHSGDHQCQCDAFQSQWMADHGEEAVVESSEEARQRLRQELLALQAKDVSSSD